MSFGLPSCVLCLLDCHAVGTVFSGEPILYSSLFHCHPYSADWEPAVHDEMCCRVLEMVVLFCTINTISRLTQIPIEYFLNHNKYSFTSPLASVHLTRTWLGTALSASLSLPNSYCVAADPGRVSRKAPGGRGWGVVCPKMHFGYENLSL